MAINRRNMVLGLALAVTLALVVWVDSQEKEQDSGVELARADRTAPRSVAPANMVATDTPPSALDWQLLAGRKSDAEKPGSDLFKSHRWYVPPPPKPAGPPPPPPKPVAPPVPFAYLGKMEDTPQGTMMILSFNNKVYTAAIGETLDKTWRLDGEDANSVRFTYVPLGLPQQLSKTARAGGVKPNETNKTESQGSDS